jgi:hypothetical protein
MEMRTFLSKFTDNTPDRPVGGSFAGRTPTSRSRVLNIQILIFHYARSMRFTESIEVI